MKDYSDKSFWLATYGEYIPSPLLAVKTSHPEVAGGFQALSDYGFHALGGTEYYFIGQRCSERSLGRECPKSHTGATW